MKESHLFNKNKENTSTVHKRLDVFIQSTLDKYTSVDPWKELYDVTGQYAYYIISNQSTIPDLVIFNKGFNKNDCFVEATRQDYIKFPRKHFILHLKQSKETNPITLPFEIKPEDNKIIKQIKEEPVKLPQQISSQISQKIPNQIPQPKQCQQQQHHKRMRDSDEEDEPEWGDDDVSEFKRNKIDFQEIPSELKKTLDNKSNENVTEIVQKIPQQSQVMTGDELFNADEESLFKSVPANLTIKANKKILEGEFSQLKKEDAFFKDLCSNQSQNQQIEGSSENNFSYGHNKNYDGARNGGMRQNNNNNSRYVYLDQYRQFNPMQMNNNMNIQSHNHQTQMMMGMNPYMQHQRQQMIMQQQQFINGMPFTNMPHMQQMQQKQKMNAMQMQMQLNNQMPHQQQHQLHKQQILQSHSNQPSNFNPMNYFINNNSNNNPNKIKLKEEDDEEDEDNDLMNDFNPKYNMYNPSVFLENPALVVKKNLFESNWVLMKDNKILGTYNSEDLYAFLNEKINDKEKLDDMTISDYQTDIVFRPMNILEILQESLPKLKRKLQMKQLKDNMNNIRMGNYYFNPMENPMMRQGFS